MQPYDILVFCKCFHLKKMLENVARCICIRMWMLASVLLPPQLRDSWSRVWAVKDVIGQTEPLVIGHADVFCHVTARWCCMYSSMGTLQRCQSDANSTQSKNVKKKNSLEILYIKKPNWKPTRPPRVSSTTLPQCTVGQMKTVEPQPGVERIRTHDWGYTFKKKILLTMKNVKKYVVLLQIQSGGTYVFLCMKHLIVAIPFANSIRKKQLLDG